MALKALSIGETREVTSKYDTGEDDNKTVFVLGVLDSTVLSTLKDKMTSFRVDTADTNDGEIDTSIATASYYLEVFAYGVQDIQNLVDGSGELVKFKTRKTHQRGKQYSVVERSVIDRIPLDVIEEIAKAILDDNLMSEEDEGN